MNTARNTASPASNFEALEVAIRMNAAVRDVVAKVRKKRSRLANQMEDAAQSTAQNLGEGRRRRGKDAAYHYSVAAGSADEALVAIRVAVAWRYVTVEECAEAMALLDRILAMTWKLTR